MISDNLKTRFLGFPRIHLEAFLKPFNSFLWQLRNNLLDKGLDFCLDMLPATQSLADNAYQGSL